MGNHQTIGSLVEDIKIHSHLHNVFRFSIDINYIDNALIFHFCVLL